MSTAEQGIVPPNGEQLFCPERRFHNQIALVTGVSRPNGIGAAICRGLVDEGLEGLIATATPRSMEQGTALTDKFTADGTLSYWIGTDITTSEGREGVISEMKERFGTGQLLFLNAGAAFDENFVRMTPENLERTLNLDLKSQMLLARYAVSEGILEKGKGRIVVNASFIGEYGRAGQEAYAAAKAGLKGFIKAGAQSLAEYGITINGVSPGYIATEMTRPTPANFREAFEVATPAGRLGTPEDVAHAMLFFADPRSGFITGQTLIVDGGLGNPGVIQRMMDGGFVRLSRKERMAVMNMRRAEQEGSA